MRGRRPAGTNYVDRVPGSEQAKLRYRTILDTMEGRLRVREACQLLGISPQRFHQLREQAIRSGVAGIEPGAPGRSPQTLSPAEQQVRILEQRLADLEIELQLAKARAEIAMTLPGRAPEPEPEPQKKNAGVVEPIRAAPPAWEEEAHVNRLCEIVLPTPPPPARTPASDGLGVARRQPERAFEHRLRVHLVDLAEWSVGRGCLQLDIAERLGLSPRTLRQWRHDLQVNRLGVQPLGRPLLRSSRADRQEVLEVLHELGPATGVPTLRACFPTLPPAELTDLLRRYRRVWRARYHQEQHVLHWQLPGAVWAIDFAEAPRPIDGIYPFVLAVRDLASGQQLAWLPVRDLTAREAVRGLQPLFVMHGAPLVLKSDNGSHFTAGDLQLFLAPWEIEHLFSPPRMPRYNGSIEAGIGSLKTRTERYATTAGRPASWTADDVEAARLEANATARPQGDAGPTPDQLWAQRQPISAERRAAFREEVERQRPAARAAIDVPMDGPWTTTEVRSLDRHAIRRALEEHGFLLYSRRRIPLPFPKRKAAIIT